MDMDLEDGEIDTVGGLILNLLEAPAGKEILSAIEGWNSR